MYVEVKDSMGKIDFEEIMVELKPGDLQGSHHTLPNVAELTEGSTDDLPGLVRMYPEDHGGWTKEEIRRLVRK